MARTYEPPAAGKTDDWSRICWLLWPGSLMTSPRGQHLFVVERVLAAYGPTHMQLHGGVAHDGRQAASARSQAGGRREYWGGWTG